MSVVEVLLCGVVWASESCISVLWLIALAEFLLATVDALVQHCLHVEAIKQKAKVRLECIPRKIYS